MEPLTAAIESIESSGCDPLAGWKVHALITGYHERWKSQVMEVVGVEETFQLPIVNPETGRSSRTYTQGGRFDLRVNFDGKRYMVEHKTTSDDIADPNSPYWRRLTIDSQVSMYALANWQSGEKLDGTIYDVIRKPTIRPKQITKADVKALTESGTYCGQQFTEEEVAESAAIEYRETPKLYAARLMEDIQADPLKYFQRRPVPRLDGDILEWAGELWTMATDIRQAELTNAHYRNSGACMAWGRPCDYLGICSGYDDPTSDKWKTRESAHPEVAMPSDVLTHSRIRCFQTCRRKHHYKYNLKIERIDEEEAEALAFGSLLHAALEAYFKSFMAVEESVECLNA